MTEVVEVNKDISNRQYGMLTALNVIPGSDPETWRCVCKCGNEVDIQKRSLLRGTHQSCGCDYDVDVRRKQRDLHTTHGKYGTKLYGVWRGMLQRCYYEKHVDHKWYAERGIGVCDEWRNDFEEFYKWAMSTGYKQGMSIDRIDNNAGYNPDNCRWTTAKEQANNRSTNIRITHDGETKNLKQWAEQFGVKYGTAYYRYRKGCKFEEIFS